MKKQIRRAIIIVNLVKEESKELLAQVQAALRSRGVAMDVFPVREEATPEVQPDTDLAITLGGDGTLLYGARTLATAARRPGAGRAGEAMAEIPILAVNLGDFGFITEISRQEWRDALEKFLEGKLGVSQRIMFDAAVSRGGSILCNFTGLNDAVIRSSEFSRIIALRIWLSGTFVARYRADGLIVATPTGSTAYSMSAGGPILHPEMEALILNPICPFTLSNRPVVVPAHEIPEVEVEAEQRTGTLLVIDGQQTFPLEPRDRVRFRRSARFTRIILSDQRNFYEVLRSKLNWAGEPNA
jgi:NAD+ kinase